MSFRTRSLIVLISLLALALIKAQNSASSPRGLLAVANQKEHTLLLVDPDARREIAKVIVGVNGHEVTVSKDGHFAYVPIYGNAGVGKPGTDGTTVDVVDIPNHKLATTIDLGKPLRPHDPHFGPDGLLYVTAELAEALDAIDPASKKVVAEIPTGVEQSHMFTITPDGKRAYTANVSTGTVSVLDLAKHTLITKISVARHVQRISVSPDGLRVFTHDQDAPRIAVIDTTNNTVSSWIDLPETVYCSAPTPDGRWLVAPGMHGHIFGIDLKTLNVAKTFDAPESLGKVLIRPDGGVAYISFLTAGKIEVIDLRSWQLQPSIDLTPGIDGMDWAAAN